MIDQIQKSRVLINTSKNPPKSGSASNVQATEFHCKTCCYWAKFIDLLQPSTL